MQPACFAPHSGGVHDNFETSPFNPSSNIWIGYLDEPEKPYRHFVSLEDLVDEAQDNYENGNKDRFPRYLITFDGRAGYSVPVHEDLMFSAQCSACKGKSNCDRVLMQYFPIKVWDYARGRKTNIFVSTTKYLILPAADINCVALRAGLQDQRSEHARTPEASFPGQIWLPRNQWPSLK